MRPAPVTRLIAPRQSLASCVPCYISRSTLGCDGIDGFNHYPATPFCSVAWMLHGDASLYDGAILHDHTVREGEAVFSGPQTKPWTTFNHGSAHLFVVMFYPDALHALSRHALSNYVDAFHPVQDVLGDDWLALGPALTAASSDDERVRLLDTFIEPRWQAARASTNLERGALGDWVRHLAVRAATSGIGRGARMIERRVRAWSGLPMRTLQRMSRAETVLLAVRAEPNVSWIDVAADSGYADQAHLSRETRAMTGLPPAALKHAMEHDESYWMYRIWR